MSITNEKQPLLKKPDPVISSLSIPVTLVNNPSFFSDLTLSWASDLIWSAHSKNIENSDLLGLPTENFSDYAFRNLSRHFDFHSQNQSVVSLLYALFRSNFWYILISNILTLFSLTLYLISPYFVERILSWLNQHHNTRGDPLWFVEGYAWMFAIFLAQFIGGFIQTQVEWRDVKLDARIKASLTVGIYHKTLNVSSSTVNEQTTGKLVNLMSTDIQRMSTVFQYLTYTYSSVIQISVCITALLLIFGWVSLVGFSILLVIFPIQAVIFGLCTYLVGKGMALKDQRVSLTNEVVQGIKIVKFFAWEPDFLKKIQKARSIEMFFLKILGILYGIGIGLMSATPVWISLLSFIVYSLLYPDLLTPEIIFPSLSYFAMLKYPVVILPSCASELVQIFVSFKRFVSFINSDTIESVSVGNDPFHPIIVKNCDFRWDVPKEKGDRVFELSNISLEVKKGQLIVIVGEIASGKTSLLEGIIGEMKKVNGGLLEVTGKVAYVPQTPFILNKTLKENILFYKDMEQSRYDQVIEGCCLLPDISMLPAKDDTEIGEKGYNLSGGQKQRLSIARAAYATSDLYLFDDPLSALDQHVGKKVFNSIITGQLKGKTRILATHQIQYLSHEQVDYIIVLDQGKIVEEGTYSELMSKSKDGLLRRLVKKFLSDNFSSSDAIIKAENVVGNEEVMETSKQHLEQLQYEKDQEPESAVTEKGIDNGINSRTTDEEERKYGALKPEVVWEYVKVFGPVLMTVSVFLFIVSQAAMEFPNWIISQWTTPNEQRLPGFIGMSDHTFLIIYASIGFGSVLLLFWRDTFFFLSGLAAGQKLHNMAIERLLKAPMVFFESNPTGRILNRFSNDVLAADINVTIGLQDFLTNIVNIIVIFGIIVYSIYWFMVPLIPIAILYYMLLQISRSGLREMRRLMSLNNSPLYSHFSETLNGLSSIRAYGMKDIFLKENQMKVDLANSTSFSRNGLNLWLNLRLNILGSFIVFFATLIIMLEYHVKQGNSITASNAGLALTYCVTVTQFLTNLVSISTWLESEFNSVERLLHYARHIPIENQCQKQPPALSDWPKQRTIEFVHYSMRYRKELPLVLKDISFFIGDKEKIGVVGKTGASKSSLFVALLRIVEGVPDGGKILIDNVNIHDISLKTLREAFGVIPQDVILLSGTIRSNLDPFNRHTDAEIWDALEKVFLKDVVADIPGQILAEVTQGGKNFSHGQRQLFCLSRCLIEKKKILLFDEATSAMDIETDSKIQKSIQENFKECTVITIAHRLNTIMHCDRILVMESGKVAEFESPSKLKKRENSLFYLLLKEAGLKETLIDSDHTNI